MRSLPLCVLPAALLIASSLSAVSEFCGASYCVAGGVSEIMEKFDGAGFIVNCLRIDTYEASIYEGGNPVEPGEDAVRDVNGIRWRITRGARGTKIEAKTGFAGRDVSRYRSEAQIEHSKRSSDFWHGFD